MARSKKNWKPIKSRESKLKNQKRVTENWGVIKKLLNELK
jgi:hypothetical protein